MAQSNDNLFITLPWVRTSNGDPQRHLVSTSQYQGLYWEELTGGSWNHQKAHSPQSQWLMRAVSQPALLRVSVAQAKWGLNPRASILAEIPEESVS